MSDELQFLLHDVARLSRRRFDERARALGVTRQQWRLLLMLQRRQGLNQGAIADLLEVEPISLCRMVDRLEEAGLVVRKPDPSDRRARIISLTEGARPLLEALRAIAAELKEVTMDGIDADEQAQTTAVILRMRENLARREQDETGSAAHG